MDRATFERLTATQLAVLWLIADHSRGAVATKLGMGSVETVKTHLARIRERLAISDTAEASRVLRTLILCPPPWVNPPWGMEASRAETPSSEQPGASSPGRNSVQEAAAPMDFAGWGGVRTDRQGADADDPSDLAHKFDLIGRRALKIVVYLLCMLAIVEALQRWVRANANLFPF